VLSQALQASRDIRGSGGLIVQMPAKLIDFGRHGGKAYALIVTFLIAATAGEDIHAESTCTGQPGVRLCRNCRGDAPRQHERRDHARTDDSERDFLHAGHHDVESRLWRRYDRKRK